MIIVRLADDFVVGFEHRGDAKQFLSTIFANGSRSSPWSCIPTRPALSSSGGLPLGTGRQRGLGKPETFDFLGFTHICGKGRERQFWLRRITIKKRMRAKLH